MQTGTLEIVWALPSSAGWSESALHHDYFTSDTRC